MIKISEKNKLNIKKLIATRMIINANSGGGKSWAIRRLLEQSHGKTQQIIIDLEGEFSTLREKFDYLLIGKDGEIPVNIKTAELLAKKLLEINVSSIIDLSELKHHERITFVKRFLDSLVNSPKKLWHPALIIVDEAHQFCPEKEKSEAALSVIDLMTRGRKRGFCGVLATQRISKLSKNAAAEANNYMIGRTGLDIDMKRVAEILGFVSKNDTRGLRDLEPGEFYLFGPAFNHNGVDKTKVGNVQTTHPDRTRGVDMKNPSKTPANIKKVLKDLIDLPKEVDEELRTINDYKKKNRELRMKLTMANKNNVGKIDEKSIEIAKDKGIIIGRRESNKLISELENKIISIGKILDKPIKYPDIKTTPIKSPEKTIEATIRPAVDNPPKEYLETKDENLSGPEKRIINAIAWFESIGINEPQQTAVAFLAGYTYGGGGFNNPRGSLRTKGLVEYRGANIALTDQGRSQSEIPENTLTTEELHNKVLSVLPGPEKKLLLPLLRQYPNDMSNEELAVLAGYTPNSGGFNNPKGRLRTLGLIDYPEPGRVRAKDLLFIY